MPTVTIESALYQRMKQAAAERQVTPGRILAQALRRYLWELDHKDIGRKQGLSSTACRTEGAI